MVWCQVAISGAAIIIAGESRARIAFKHSHDEHDRTCAHALNKTKTSELRCARLNTCTHTPTMRYVVMGSKQKQGTDGVAALFP